MTSPSLPRPIPEAEQSWGLFGGAFDPIHRGHLRLAKDVLVAEHLHGVLLVPSGRSPHREESCKASFNDRLAMIRAAIVDEPQFTASSIELDQNLSGYTLHSVQALKKEFLGVNWYLIVGADHARTFGSWYQPNKILREVKLMIVGARPGFNLDMGFPAAPGRVEYVQSGLVDTSSSEIRRRIAAGITKEELTALVPAGVADYIVSHKLYQT